MSKRSTHLFQFTGKQISDAAQLEHAYHEVRAGWWKDEQQAMIDRAKAIGTTVNVSEWQHSGGKGVAVSASNPELDKINTRLQECGTKIASHQKSADTFRIEADCYGTQPDRVYELEPDDVVYFRLAGGPREV